MFKKLDLLGTIFGIIGAILIALNLGINFIGYLFFTLSSICYVIWGVENNKNILILNSVFLVINIIGLFSYS